MAEGGFAEYTDYEYPYGRILSGPGLDPLLHDRRGRREVEDKPIFVIGGHDFVFVDGLSAGQTCSICLLAMRNPVQTICGHRFCESCLKETFKNTISEANVYTRYRHASRDQVCPQDRNPIPEYGGFFRDAAWEREILSLRVKCKKSERGCDWTGQLRHYEEHFLLCEYEDVTCDVCDEEIQRRLMQTHTTSECRNRIVQCEYCDNEFEFWLTATHNGDECTRFPLDCPQKCGVQIPREEVESHARDDCMMTMVVCPYEGAGCTFYDIKSNLQTHLEVSSEEHLNKTWSMTKEQLDAVEGENVTLKKDVTELQERLDAVEGENVTLEKDVTELQERLDAVEDENVTLKKDETELQEQLNAVEGENVTLKKDVTELQKQFEEAKHTIAYSQQEISLLHQLVKNLQTVVTNREISQMSGYLKYKKGRRGWKKLWFVLKDNVLYGYKAGSVATLETLDLSILRCHIERLDKDGDNCTFKLFRQDNDIPPVFFKADDEISVRRWIQELKKSI